MGGAQACCCQGADKEKDKELASNDPAYRGVAPTTHAEESIPVGLEESHSTPAAPAVVVEAPQAPAVVVPAPQAQEFTIKLNKANDPSGGKLGIDVHLTDGVTLHVDKVTEGMVGEWNKQNPDQQVKKGDRVISVNGSSGNAQQLTQVCKKNEVLEMVVKRGGD